MKKVLISLFFLYFASVVQALQVTQAIQVAQETPAMQADQEVKALQVAQAKQPIKINWKDLQGAVAPYADPFKALTEQQRYHLSLHARVVDIQKTMPNRVTDAMREASEGARESLIKDNINIELLFEQRDKLIESRQQAMRSSNELLTDKLIEMSGYMLALSFENGLVSEFLLVPTIGACSHKPVPPANQIILVHTQKSVVAGAAYEPITVTGILRSTPQAKDLYLVDGQKSIEMTYSLDSTKVAPYKSPY